MVLIGKVVVVWSVMLHVVHKRLANLLSYLAMKGRVTISMAYVILFPPD